MVRPSLSDVPVSSAAMRTGFPGTAIEARFIATARETSVVLPAKSPATATKLTKEFVPIAIQSSLVNVYDHVPAFGVTLFTTPANDKETVAPDSTVPLMVMPASFSASVMSSLPPIALIAMTGGVVSMRHTTTAEVTDVLPAVSVASAVIE